MSRSRIALLALFAALSGGCGTIRNLASSQPEPYGGVGYALEYDAAVRASPQGQSDTCVSGSSPLEMLWDLAWCCPDTCTSAVGDTITLPIVLARMPKATKRPSSSNNAYWQMPAAYTVGANAAGPDAATADPMSERPK